jgi:hypothetical protein
MDRSSTNSIYRLHINMFLRNTLLYFLIFCTVYILLFATCVWIIIKKVLFALINT